MNIFILSGGNHPYEESTPILKEFLTNAGHSTIITEDASKIENTTYMNQFDVLVFNTLRVGDLDFTKTQQECLKNLISSGKGFICIHISGCIPDNWQEYREITGGGWEMAKSFHPPFSKFNVKTNKNHPIVNNVPNFETNDELYMNIEYENDNEVFLTANADEGTYEWRDKPVLMPAGEYPLGWTRKYGNGKVMVTLLGHNGLSFKTKEFQKIILNGINWSNNS